MKLHRYNVPFRQRCLVVSGKFLGFCYDGIVAINQRTLYIIQERGSGRIFLVLKPEHSLVSYILTATRLAGNGFM